MGNRNENMGYTACEACCVCGGGDIRRDDICPEVPTGVHFPDYYDPHVCSKAGTSLECEYQNFESAEGAGWKRHQCEKLQDDTPTCPLPNNINIGRYNPVICNHQDDISVTCEYDNMSQAFDAGFFRNQCRRRQDDTPTCPLPNNINIGRYNPVICNHQDDRTVTCEYDNMSQALDAGFFRNQCKRRQDDTPTCPVPNNFINASYNPVICNHQDDRTVTCEYDNMSQARDVGFGLMDCVSAWNCPAVPNKTPCDNSYEPLRCIGRDSGDRCDYNNLCEAEAAGFSRHDCIRLPIS